MKPIRRQLAKLKAWFLGLGLVRRMLIGYLFVIFIPVLGIGSMYYNQVNERALRSYTQNSQELLGQIRGSFEIDLAQIESLHQLFQFNFALVDYMSGMYRAESDQVYEFKKNIEPVSAYVYATNPFLNAVRIYQRNPDVMPLGRDLREWDERLSNDPVLDGLAPGEGKWLFGQERQGVRLTYYRKLYARDFIKPIGMLEVDVSERLLTRLFDRMDMFQGANIYLVDGKGKMVYSKEAMAIAAEERAGLFRLADKDIGSHIDKSLLDGVLVHYVRLNGLDTTVVVVTDIRNVVQSGAGSNALLLGYVALLLVLLSFVYYYIFSSTLRRMIKLARHMRRIDEHTLLPYRSGGYRDEIGVLEHAYNTMIERIHELIHTVHRAEMRQKEAAFLALQAQINPHFLYNSLESIRMMAEMKGDGETANMSYLLGELLRYSLAVKKETTLSDEIHNVTNYLKIQKIRLGSRLHYDIGIEADISCISCPRFILQPLVENAVVHGIAKLRKGGKLAIAIQEQGQDIRIVIADDGIGIDEPTLQGIRERLQNPGSEADDSSEAKRGIGLTNVNERLIAYYGPESRIAIASEPGRGTTYTIALARNRGRSH